MFSMSNHLHVRDKYIEKILIATSLKPMTASGVAKIFGIPIAICHRKIKMLEGMGLVTCAKRIVTEERGTVKFYSAREEKVKVAKDDGQYIVRIDIPHDKALDISIGWRDFVA
jgi:predicted transcriptional regulator